MAGEISRRQFFRLGLGDVANMARTNEQSTPEKTTYFRPPGARPEEEFLTLCERCDCCVESCPHDVLTSLGPAAGKAEKTPTLSPGKKACHWCVTMDCIESCPSGALAFNANHSADPIGKAVLSLEACLNQQGILCDDCAVVCPEGVKAIRILERQPRIDEDKCVGCGLCAVHCAADPPALRIEPLPNA